MQSRAMTTAPCKQAVLLCVQALITTYELVLKDASILNHIKWNYMMVDEAHRLKNHESALYQEMTQFSFKNRLLITGQAPAELSMALLHSNSCPCCAVFSTAGPGALPLGPIGMTQWPRAMEKHGL